MPEGITVTLIVFVLVALTFDFLNGFHDSSNIVSTMISSRALAPRTALTLTAICEFVGPFAFGVAVAHTIGDEVLARSVQTIPVVLAALSSAVLWNVLTWYFGIPSSSSHALIGGLVGAGITENLFASTFLAGFSMEDVPALLAVIEPAGVTKVALALLLSPALGFVTGYLALKLIRFLARGARPKINLFFKRAQVVTAIGLALSHGTNDAQKTMGVITLGLVTMGYLTEFKVPIWVVAMSAGAIAIGTAIGGWRLIRTLGGKFYKIRPVHGFDTQISAAAVIFGASMLGGPVSTTQVVSSAIMGAGSAERFSKVRWGVGKQIAVTWLITFPATAVVGGLLLVAIRSWI